MADKQERGRSIVSESVEAHGGMGAFKQLKSISFTKRTKLFFENGTIESDITQRQSFQLKPSLLTEIEWVKDSQKHTIFYDGLKAIKTINGSVVSDSVEIIKAENSAKAASYVFFQPFKLLTDNADFIYEGDMDLNDSVNVGVVRIKYKSDTAASDKWRYYFNDDDVVVANSVFLSDHNSLIENIQYQEVAGLLFNKYRKSYRIDTLLNKKYLRAEYWYTDVKYE